MTRKFRITNEDGSSYVIEADSPEDAQHVADEHDAATGKFSGSKVEQGKEDPSIYKSPGIAAKVAAEGLPIVSNFLPKDDESELWKQQNPRATTGLHAAGTVAGYAPVIAAAGPLAAATGIGSKLAAETGLSTATNAVDQLTRPDHKFNWGELGVSALGPTAGNKLANVLSPASAEAKAALANRTAQVAKETKLADPNRVLGMPEDRLEQFYRLNKSFVNQPENVKATMYKNALDTASVTGEEMPAHFKAYGEELARKNAPITALEQQQRFYADMQTKAAAAILGGAGLASGLHPLTDLALAATPYGYNWAKAGLKQLGNTQPGQKFLSNELFQNPSLNTILKAGVVPSMTDLYGDAANQQDQNNPYLIGGP